MPRVLLSTTSYQDTPGAHHALLASSSLDVVRARGPLKTPELLALLEEHGGFDGLLCGDDELTAEVVDAYL